GRGYRGPGARQRRAGPVVADEPVRAQGRARRDRRDRWCPQRVRRRGAVAAGSRTRRAVIPADEPARPTPGHAPNPPPVAAALFGEHLQLAARFVDRLASDGVVRGLIGPREVDRLWERHLVNSALVTDLVPDGARIVDVG